MTSGYCLFLVQLSDFLCLFSLMFQTGPIRVAVQYLWLVSTYRSIPRLEDHVGCPS